MAELYGLPEGWAFASLGEVGEYINGRAFKPSEWEDEGLPIIRIQNLTGTSSKFNRCSKEVERKYYVKNGDLLISWSASLGVFIWAEGDALLNQHIFRVEPNYDIVTKKFLFYASKYVLRELERKTHGTGMVHVTKGLFEETKIPLPPLNEQHRIVARLEQLLSQVNIAKEHMAQVPPLLKQFRQSVLAAACSGELTKEWRKEHPEVEPASELLKWIQEERMRRYEEECEKAKKEGEKIPKIPTCLIEFENLEPEWINDIPYTWTVTPFGRIIDSGPQNGLYRPQSDYGQGELIVRIDDFYDGYIHSWDTLKRLKISREEIETYCLNNDDILINRVNSIKFLGKSALVRNLCDPCVFESNMMRLRLHKGCAYPEYVIKYLQSTLGLNELRKNAKHAVNQSSINQRDVKSTGVILPPIKEQEEIVRRIDSLFKLADSIEQRHQKAQAHLERLTPAILAKAFRGELVPQDPNDEPASVLLERIKQERAKNEKGNKKRNQKKSRTLLDYC